MPYLMHIGFDNNYRLFRRIFYFEYKGIRFKLIQNNPHKWQDVLLTIINDPDDREAQNVAFETAGEFISALSWQNGSRMKLCNIGGRGIRPGYSIRQARCSSFTFPNITFGGLTIGGDISVLPQIENENQKIALTLFREAKSACNIYLSFLFYWQILEIGRASAVGWVNKAFRRRHENRLFIEPRWLSFIDSSRPIGQYLEDDCRNAIAHIKRQPGKVVLALDNLKDRTRMEVSARIVERFAHFYIEKELALKKRLFLVKKFKSPGFPVYVAEENTRSKPYVIAYEKKRVVGLAFKDAKRRRLFE